MAMKIDVEHRRTDVGFFIPVANVNPDWEHNTRCTKPDSGIVSRLKKSIKMYEGLLGINRGQITPAEFLLDENRRPKLDAGRHRHQALAELEAEDGQVRELWCVPFVPKRGMSDEITKEVAILRSIDENAKHTPPTAMVFASNIKTLREIGWDTQRIANHFDQSPAWVTETEKLMDLPEDLQDQVASGEISREDGIFLAAKVEPDKRHEVLAEALRIAAERLQKVGSVAPTTEGEEEEEEDPEVTDAENGHGQVAAPAPAPAPQGKGSGKGTGKGSGKGKKADPVTKTRNVGKVTHNDIVKAAENKDAVDPNKLPARKMTEVVRFFKELIETAPDNSYASLFAKDFLRWKDRKLKDETWENKIYDYTHTKLGTVVSDGKKGGRK